MTYFPDRISNSAPARTSNRQVARSVGEVRNGAVLKAVKLEAIGFVATVGLHQIDGLTMMEAQLVRQNPLGSARYEAIVDTATAAIATEISRMAW